MNQSDQLIPKGHDSTNTECLYGYPACPCTCAQRTKENSPQIRRSLLLADYLIELYDQNLISENTDSKELLPILERDMKFIDDDMKKKGM